MKKIVSTILFIFISNLIINSNNYKNLPDDVIFYFLKTKPIVYRHINPVKEKMNTIVITNENIGNVMSLPKILSKKNNQKIEEASDLYIAKNFKNACDILKNIYMQEPDNPFVLNEYARTLYWYDSVQSFEIYKKLIKILDSDYLSQKKEVVLENSQLEYYDNKIQKELDSLISDLSIIYNQETIIIDLWFIESYWKLGTLYMDERDYINAIFEITRALTSNLYNSKTALEQAYNYLTKAYFYLNKFELSMFCANKALQLNSNNDYVIKYMEKFSDEQ